MQRNIVVKQYAPQKCSLEAVYDPRKLRLASDERRNKILKETKTQTSGKVPGFIKVSFLRKTSCRQATPKSFHVCPMKSYRLQLTRGGR